jgi:hypothetical protein
MRRCAAARTEYAIECCPEQRPCTERSDSVSLSGRHEFNRDKHNRFKHGERPRRTVIHVCDRKSDHPVGTIADESKLDTEPLLRQRDYGHGVA